MCPQSNNNVATHSHDSFQLTQSTVKRRFDYVAPMLLTRRRFDCFVNITQWAHDIEMTLLSVRHVPAGRGTTMMPCIDRAQQDLGSDCVSEQSDQSLCRCQQQCLDIENDSQQLRLLFSETCGCLWDGRAA